MYRRKGAITIFPSVWRDTGCESHFILWKDQILLFGNRNDDYEVGKLENVDIASDVVLGALPIDALASFQHVAERIDALPWDVLATCRDLVRQGKAFEGTGKERGHFGRRLP